MSTRTALAAVMMAFSTGHPAIVSSQASVPQHDRSFTSGTTAILVDVVVRDRKGRPITDLAVKDFEVREDGRVQKVDTFTRISSGTGIGVDVGWKRPGTASPTAATASADEAETDAADVGATAIVFDHLTADTLRTAQRATLASIPMNGTSSALVGIFATGPGVRTVQAFTRDRSLTRRAVAALAPSGSSRQEDQAQRTDDILARRRQLQSDTQLATVGGGLGTAADLARNGSELGNKQTELKLLQTELNMLRSFDSLEREHKGHDTATGLLTVVRSLAEYPGRKTIVFFSEGLPVSPSLSARLDAVIDAAGKANVTVYAVDAQGLRPLSSSTNLQKQVAAHADERMAQVSSGTNSSEEPLTLAFERIEDTLTLDSRTGLARLAHDTGGFLVEGSNDLSSAFRRIDEDQRFHYLLTYAPTNTVFDGAFRRIHVSVGRPGAQVFARKGYRAVRSGVPGASGLYASEALSLLAASPLPNAFPVHAAAFTFPEPARPGLTPVLVRVSTSQLRYRTDSARGVYSAHAVIAVRILNGAREEVEKLSQEYVLSGDVKDLAAARKGEILFYREPQLRPGVYTVESVVYDGNARQASARLTTLTVPQSSAALQLSSLVIVDRSEEVSDPPSAGAPLFIGRTLLYPNLGQPLPQGRSDGLAFFFTVYGSAPPTAAAELLRNGGVLAAAPMELAAARAGRVQHVGKLPIGGLPAGTYELRIRIGSGSQSESRSAFFTIE